MVKRLYLKFGIAIAGKILCFARIQSLLRLLLRLWSLDLAHERHAEALVPGVVEAPDEEAQAGGLGGELGADDGAGAREGDAAAVEEDALENLGGQPVEAYSRLQLARVLDVAERALHLGR